MEITSDDKIWSATYAGGFLGATIRHGKWTNGSSPGADARPYAMVRATRTACGRRDRGEPVRLVDSKTLQSRRNAVPSGGGVVRHMFYDPATKRSVRTDNNTIGRAILSRGRRPRRDAVKKGGTGGRGGKVVERSSFAVTYEPSHVRSAVSVRGLCSWICSSATAQRVPPLPPCRPSGNVALQRLEWREIGPFRGGRVTAVPVHATSR